MDAICLILSGAGGFADAGSFMLIRTFTGHVTGNGLLTAVYLVKGEFSVALLCALAVVAFMSGTAAGTGWQHEGVTPSASMMKPLFVEFVMIAVGLVVFALGGVAGKVLLAVAVCFALGLRNGTLNRLGSVSIHSTYITGMATSLVGAVFKGERDARRVLQKVIAGFLAGALVGAFLVERFGEAGYALVLLPIGVALGLSALSWRRCGRGLWAE